jgi:uncharacterized membrane protein
VASIVIIARIGWCTGFIKTFFTVLAGFLAIFTANKYPYQEGLNFYLIFVIIALFIIMLGNFTLRFISFFYLNILDKAAGMILSICVWLIISVNIIIPAVTYTYDEHTLYAQKHTIYKNISNVIQSKIPVFKNYVPRLLEKSDITKK